MAMTASPAAGRLRVGAQQQGSKEAREGGEEGVRLRLPLAGGSFPYHRLRTLVPALTRMPDDIAGWADI